MHYNFPSNILFRKFVKSKKDWEDRKIVAHISFRWIYIFCHICLLSSYMYAYIFPLFLDMIYQLKGNYLIPLKRTLILPIFFWGGWGGVLQPLLFCHINNTLVKYMPQSNMNNQKVSRTFSVTHYILFYSQRLIMVYI